MKQALVRLVQIQAILYLLFLLTEGSAIHIPSKSTQGHDTSQFLSRRILDESYYQCETTAGICSTEVREGRTNHLFLIGSATQDFILSIGGQSDDLKITYDASSPEMELELRILKSLDPVSSGSIISAPDGGRMKWSLIIDSSIIQSHQREYLVLRMRNTGASPVKINVTFSFNEVPVLMIVLIAAGSAAFVLICIIGLLYFRLRRRQMILEMQWAIRNRQPQQEQCDHHLSASNMDNRFPQTLFEKIENNSLAQTTCSVCLEDMQAGVMCRQLYCNHIFHSDCIKLWLVNRIEKSQAVSCPNCNRDVSTPPEKLDVKEITDEK